MKFLKFVVLFCHLTTILSIVFLTFRVLDWFNPLMAFSATMSSSWLMVLFCASGIISSTGSLILIRNMKRTRDDAAASAS